MKVKIGGVEIEIASGYLRYDADSDTVFLMPSAAPTLNHAPAPVPRMAPLPSEPTPRNEDGRRRPRTPEQIAAAVEGKARAKAARAAAVYADDPDALRNAKREADRLYQKERRAALRGKGPGKSQAQLEALAKARVAKAAKRAADATPERPRSLHGEYLAAAKRAEAAIVATGGDLAQTKAELTASVIAFLKKEEEPVSAQMLTKVCLGMFKGDNEKRYFAILLDDLVEQGKIICALPDKPGAKRWYEIAPPKAQAPTRPALETAGT
jgi:hypothetical protein